MTEDQLNRKAREIAAQHKRGRAVLDAKPAAVLAELEAFAATLTKAVKALSPAARHELEFELPDQVEILEARKKARPTDESGPLVRLFTRPVRNAIGGMVRDDPSLRDKANARGQDTRQARDLAIMDLAALYREYERTRHAAAAREFEESWGDVEDSFDWGSRASSSPKRRRRYKEARAEVYGRSAYQARMKEFLRETLDEAGLIDLDAKEPISDATIWRKVPKSLTEPPWK